jgi:hypothetical protein
VRCQTLDTADGTAQLNLRCQKRNVHRGHSVIISIVVLYAASMATAPPPEHKLEDLTFARTDTGEITYTKADVIASAAVATVILGLYIYFSYFSGLFF